MPTCELRHREAPSEVVTLRAGPLMADFTKGWLLLLPTEMPVEDASPDRHGRLRSLPYVVIGLELA